MSINDDPTSDAIVANTLRNMDSVATAMDTSSPPTPFLFRRHRQLSFQLRHLSLTALRLRARSRQRGRQYINSTTSSTIPLLLRLRRLLQRLTRLFAPPPFPLLLSTSRSPTSKLLARRLLCLRLRVHHLRLRPGCLQWGDNIDE
ncbi:hypothetical protein MHU86_22272 [Fragilaria crotonensis]|nr:hypothetical protein MHU86_22272 [Fragilaria crotonensis]